MSVVLGRNTREHVVDVSSGDGFDRTSTAKRGKAASRLGNAELRKDKCDKYIEHNSIY